MIITDIDMLISMWETDCVLSEHATDVPKETARIPRLNAKYLGIRTKHSLMVKKIEGDYRNMCGLKRSYYRGEISDPAILEKYGWEQWKNNKVLKNSLDSYLETDEDLNAIAAKKNAHQEIVDFCNVVIKELNSRTYQIRYILETEKYFGGHG